MNDLNIDNTKVNKAAYYDAYKGQAITTPIYHAGFHAGNTGRHTSVPPPNFIIWLLKNEKIKTKL
ncbi:MAG: hypothetical protein GX220_03085 [Treponema sp.]|nr:hypothetical protein [Treponema sp.]